MATKKNVELIQELTVAYYTKRADRLALERTAADAKKLEDGAYQQLLAAMQKFGIDSIESAAGPCRMEMEAKPTITSWPELCAFIHKRKAFELLQKRLAVAAVRERYDANEAIPGVTVTEEPVLKFARA